MTTENPNLTRTPPAEEQVRPERAASFSLDVENRGIVDAFRGYFFRLRTGEPGALPAVMGLIALGAIFSQVSGNFLTKYNIGNLPGQGAYIAIIGLGLIFVLLLGEIDLSAGTLGGMAAGFAAQAVFSGNLRHAISGGVFWSLVGGMCAMFVLGVWLKTYTASLIVLAGVIVVVTNTDSHLLGALFAAIALGTAVGIFDGFLVAKVGIPSFIVTLAVFISWQGMLLFELREKGRADNGQVARALTLIESFLVRRMICRVSSNGLNRIFTDLPSQLAPELPVDEAIHQALSAARRSWPTDAELLEAILAKPFYLYGRAAQRMFVLRRLEESYEHPEPVDFAATKLTVEHILPQTPSAEWLAALAQDARPGEDAAEVHERLLHTLGNLTLTAQNAKLSNHPFDRKKSLFDHSHLELNREIAETSQWGAAEIEARGRELAARAVKLWPAPLPGIARVERGRDWSLLHQALAALPYGTWTTYGDVAALIGSAAQPVGSHLSVTSGVVNAWRVLGHDGKVAAAFQWAPGEDRGDVHAVLQAEGVRFDEATMKADSKQRLSAQALAALLDLGDDDDDH